MEQKAKVIKGGEIATIEVVRNSACGDNCASCSGCSEGSRRLLTRANNLVDAQEGNIVWVETSDRDILKKAFIVYILPCFAFFIGYLIPDMLHRSTLTCSLIGVACFAAAFFCVYLYDKKLRREDKLPDIIRIVQ